jgi:6-pyruvoyltetrahydropterin/6-carboxytetrahydropterin synthase
MFELTVERQFSAAHCLKDHPGPCARLHGHNYRVRASFRGSKLDASGLLVDFALLKQRCDEALEPLDHQYLNDLPEFADANPSAETLAVYLYEEFGRLTADLPVEVAAVTIYESETAAVTYRED